MSSTMKVSINLSDIDCNEPLPDRIISLSHPDFSIVVGRGSTTDDTLEPRPENAYFASRVMSRQHATIKADPESRILTIQDTGSMHGTALNGSKVGKEPTELLPADILTFGAEVVRGEETYQPLKICITYEWEGEQGGKEISNNNGQNASFRNQFSVDFSEEDIDSDLNDEEDVQFVSSSVREPSLEILHPTTWCGKAQSTPTKLDKAPVTIPTYLNSSEKSHDATANPSDYEDDLSDDNDEDADLDSDLIEREDSFLENSDEEEHSEQPVEAVPAMQCVLSPGIEAREASPSDAALARPRLINSNIDANGKGVNGYVPPRPSAYTASPNLYNDHNTTNPQILPHNYFHDSPRPNHNWIAPYSYISPTCVNRIQSSSVSISMPHFEFPPTPPPPPPRGVQHAWSSAPSHCSVAESLSMTGESQRPTEVFRSSDGLRGQKRKAEAISNAIDNESVSSSPIDRRNTKGVLESSSPRESSSASATDNLPISTAINKVPSALSLVDEFIEPSPEKMQSMIADVLHEGDACYLSSPEKVFDHVRSPSTQEPPLKKIKTSYGKYTRASTVFKYTVTALAGATVGALGTVVGLASLPVDYFV